MTEAAANHGTFTGLMCLSLVLTKALIVTLIACAPGSRQARVASKTVSRCPTMPRTFGVEVERAVGHGTISVMLRNDELVVRGGEHGDVRTLEATATESDTAMLERLFCELHRAKFQLESEETYTDVTTTPRLRVSRDSRTNAGSIWWLVSSPRAVQTAERALETWAPRLPPARMPPVDSYVTPIADTCEAPSDFQLQVFRFGARRFAVEADGSFAFTRTIRGVLPRAALDAIACKIASYDFSVLATNPENRRVLCPEGVRYGCFPGSMCAYSGAAFDVQMNGVVTHVRVGWCPAPLDLRAALESAELKAAMLYSDRTVR